MIDRSFLKNGSWAFAGNFLYALLQWAILVVFAKLGSAHSVGLFTLGLAVTAPVVLFLNLQLRNVIATDVKDVFKFHNYYGLRLFTGIIALFSIALIILAIGYDEEAGFVIIAVGLSKVIEGVSDIFYGLFQRHEKFAYISISKIVRGILGLIAIAVVIHLIHSVFWSVIVLSAAWTAVLFFYDIPHGNSLVAPFLPNKRFIPPSPKLDISNIKNLIYLTIPLGFVEMIASFSINTPRYFIESKVGISELGIFSSLSYFMVAGGTLIYAMGQAAMPRLAQCYQDNDKKTFRKILLFMTAFSIIVGVFGIVIAAYFGQFLLTLFYRHEFAAYNDSFVIIMIAAALNYIATTLWFGIASAWRFKIQIVIFGIALIVNIIACAWLIPLHGILGGSIALTVSELFRVIVSFTILVWITRSGLSPSLPINLKSVSSS